MGCTPGRTPLPFRLTPCSPFDGYELDACRVGEAEERACPGRDRILIGDIWTDQERKGVVVAEDKLAV